MTAFEVPHRRTFQAMASFLVIVVAGCAPAESGRLQGYVDGEFVYVASALPGELKSLPVQRGAQVNADAPLFVLDATPEKAARDEVARRVEQARATLEDARKAKRPSEIEALAAQLKQARSALALSESQLARQERLSGTFASTADDLDRARSARNQDRHRVEQLEAELQTARLGSRPDQITALEASLRALESELAKSEWELAQKSRTAPQSGLVFDTLFRVGEWVAAGRPVVVLLPPEYVKVRAFVPETQVGSIHVGDAARVLVDGTTPVTGKVTFISPRAEFTPPVIYSRESRSKLVFMIEIRFDRDTAAQLHPGQPVDVEFGP